MKAHIVLAHPESHSFNGRLAGISQEKLAAAGFEITFSDLYALGFDPSEGPQHYQHRSDTERFLIHPMNIGHLEKGVFFLPRGQRYEQEKIILHTA